MVGHRQSLIERRKRRGLRWRGRLRGSRWGGRRGLWLARRLTRRKRLAVAGLGNHPQDPFDHLIGVDALGVGVEIGEDAVSEHGICHGADVLGLHGETPPQDRPGFRAEDHVLGRAGAGAPGEPFLNEVGARRFFRSCCPGDVDRVIDHVAGGRYLADQLLDPEHVLAPQNRLHLAAGVLRGGHYDVALFLAVGIADVDREHEAVQLGLGSG